MSLRGSVATVVVNALAAWNAAWVVDTDPNVPFEPPAGGLWARLRFADGAESFRSVGGATSLAVQPVLVYVDLYLPLGGGDGLATEAADVVRDSLRRKVLPEGRWKRFEEGPEGREDGRYRKQVVAVFWRTMRK